MISHYTFLIETPPEAPHLLSRPVLTCIILRHQKVSSVKGDANTKRLCTHPYEAPQAE